ncbi:MAG: Hsp20/alpha crystallin family protein [Pseudomonadota bacterium]|jgi:HSP20 family protein
MNASGGKNGGTFLRPRQYPILSLFDEMNRLFEDAVPFTQTARGGSGFKPTIDLVEGEKEYILTGEFPGLDVADIEIELRDNTITLRGEKRSHYEQKEGDRVHIERAFGSFCRSFSFNVEVDEDNAAADMKNGVLTVRIPKSAKVLRGTKKLSIKAA